MYFKIDGRYGVRLIGVIGVTLGVTMFSGCSFSDEGLEQANASGYHGLYVGESLMGQQFETNPENTQGKSDSDFVKAVNLIAAKNQTIYETDTTNIILDNIPDEDYSAYFDAILQELSAYMGYQFVYTSIYVDDSQIKVDFTPDTAPISEEAILDQTKMGYTDYDEMVFGILDSIALTLKANDTMQRAVYFSLDGESMAFPGLSADYLLNAEEEFVPFVSDQRIEKDTVVGEKASSENNPLTLSFGVSQEEISVWLKNRNIKYDKWEDYSNLGDYKDASEYHSVADLCKDAYKETLYLANDFMIIFDGPEGVLTSVVIQSDYYETANGLSLSDHKADMERLYGKSYQIYDDEECSLYEYRMEEGYFVVCIDDNSDEIIYMKLDAYSHQDYLYGMNLLNKLVEKDLNYK